MKEYKKSWNSFRAGISWKLTDMREVPKRLQSRNTSLSEKLPHEQGGIRAPESIQCLMSKDAFVQWSMLEDGLQEMCYSLK